jgi:uncharacterized protein (DUF169 family)
MMVKWIELDNKVNSLVKPDTFPVAVKFLDDETKIPAKARRPLRDLGVKMAPCQGAGMARRYGWSVAFTSDDVGCAIAGHTYGWERLTDPQGAVHFLTRMRYVSDDQAALEALSGFRMLELEPAPVVLYSPLGKTPFDPDVVLLYVNPAQMMRLIHGATYQAGKPIQGTFSGRASSCTEGVIGAYLDQSPKVVVPGNGDRVWAGCQDHEMVMAVPGPLLESVVEGLEVTHGMGVRYPIPAFLGYRPVVGLRVALSDIFTPEKTVPLFGERPGPGKK